MDSTGASGPRHAKVMEVGRGRSWGSSRCQAGERAPVRESRVVQRPLDAGRCLLQRYQRAGAVAGR